MYSYRLPAAQRWRPQANPVGYGARRLTSLVFAGGAILGMAAVSLLEGAGVPILFALAIGLVLFVAVATVGTSAAGAAEVRSRRAAADTAVRPSGLAGRLHEWAQAFQLGRDTEQVIGRNTGARI